MNYFIYGCKDVMFPDTEIFLHKLIATKNSDLTKINVIYCVKSSALFYPPLSERRAVLASQTSLKPWGRGGRSTPATLALASKELVESVRAILDVDCKFSEFLKFFKK